MRSFNNATAFRLGLGAAAGTLRLDLADGDHHANFREGTDADYEVDVRRLDDVPEVQALPTVDFLKVDVEGWESQVMDGATNLWNQHKIGMALIEANPAWGPVDYLDTFMNLGYQCFGLLPRRAVGGLRNVLHLQTLDPAYLPPQVNVLVVRPDRMDRLRANPRTRS